MQVKVSPTSTVHSVVMGVRGPFSYFTTLKSGSWCCMVRSEFYGLREKTLLASRVTWYSQPSYMMSFCLSLCLFVSLLSANMSVCLPVSLLQKVFTAAMLEGWNNETVLHENRFYFPGERKCIVLALQCGGNDVTWKCFMLYLLNQLEHQGNVLKARSPGCVCICFWSENW